MLLKSIQKYSLLTHNTQEIMASKSKQYKINADKVKSDFEQTETIGLQFPSKDRHKLLSMYGNLINSVLCVLQFSIGTGNSKH